MRREGRKKERERGPVKINQRWSERERTQKVSERAKKELEMEQKWKEREREEGC